MQCQFLGDHIPTNAKDTQVAPVTAIHPIAQAGFDRMNTKADQPHVEQTGRQSQAGQAQEIYIQVARK